MTPELRQELAANRQLNSLPKKQDLTKSKGKVGIAPATGNFDPFAIGAADKSNTEMSILEQTDNNLLQTSNTNLLQASIKQANNENKSREVSL